MSKQGRLSAMDVGAWLFKCNPKQWDILEAERGRKPIHAWRAFPTYRLDLFDRGHPAPVLLWVTGPSGATPEPGIRMAGYTTGGISQTLKEASTGSMNSSAASVGRISGSGLA